MQGSVIARCFAVVSIVVVLTIGLAAISTTGEPLGHVVAVENFGAGDILEIERPAEAGKKAQRFMVPMTTQAVPDWGDVVTINADFIA